jgi:hypothetical protein
MKKSGLMVAVVCGVMVTGMRGQAIPPAVKAAETSIDGERIRAHVKFLANDLLEGRGPGLRGEEIAAE